MLQDFYATHCQDVEIITYLSLEAELSFKDVQIISYDAHMYSGPGFVKDVGNNLSTQGLCKE